MKTHHWMGVTGQHEKSLRRAARPRYGWPKNVLHHNGIPETVYDINASLPSLLAIVDGIDCMEGDGPIMGSLKPMGLVVVGTNLPAVDATVARIMGLGRSESPTWRSPRIGSGRSTSRESRNAAKPGETSPARSKSSTHRTSVNCGGDITSPLVT